jgi:MFS family permease
MSSTRSRGALWRNPDFLKFWAGETLSLYGTQVTTLALPLTAVLVFDAGPEQVGFLRFMQLAPYPAFALLFGVWVDRVRRRPLMLGANSMRAVLIGLVPVLAGMDRLTQPVLLVLAFGIGVASVLFDVSWMSYLPGLLRDKKYLVEANSKLSITASSADAAGPGLAGVLISALTAPMAMVVDAVSYLVSVVLLAAIPTREPAPSSAAARRHLLAELADGLRWVFGNSYLRSIAFVGAFCNFFTMATSTMFIVYAVRDGGLSPAQLGVVFSLGAVGGLLGSLVSGRLLARYTPGQVYFWSLAGTFIGPVLIPLAAGPHWLVLGLFVASFFIAYGGLAVSNVLIVSLRQTVTPPHLMGRMNAAIRTLLFAGGALGGPVSGLLAGTVGLRPALWTIGAAAVLMLLPVLLSPVSRLAAMPETHSKAPLNPIDPIPERTRE